MTKYLHNKSIDFAEKTLLRQIDAAGKNVAAAVEKALVAASVAPSRKMLSFIAKHRLTGETEASFVSKVSRNGDKVSFVCGFDVARGGEPAVYLNYGGPHQEPTHFVTDAIDSSATEIYKAMNETLREIVEAD